MFVLLRLDLETNGVYPEMIFENDNPKMLNKYLQGYCVKIIKELEKDTKISFTDKIICDVNQLNTLKNGYYFLIIDDNKIEIYHKMTSPDGWFFTGGPIITKKYVLSISFCNKDSSVMPENNLDKNLFDELSTKLAERRKLLCDK